MATKLSSIELLLWHSVHIERAIREFAVDDKDAAANALRLVRNTTLYSEPKAGLGHGKLCTDLLRGASHGSEKGRVKEAHYAS